MNEGIEALLSYIVSRYATADEQRRVELDANAELSGTEIEADKAAGVEREQAAADRQADAFARGLHLAYAHHAGGGGAISLDDRNPAENAMAEALIHFLVRFDLASSHAREVDDQQYVYDITVDWPQLRDIAAETGYRLDDLFDTPDGAV